MGKWAKKTASEWEAIFEAQAGSGITGAGFCRGQGINYRHFLYFRKKRLRRGQAQSLAWTAPAGVLPSVRQHRFTPVMVEKSRGIRLRFSRGLVLESDVLLPASWVAEVASLWLSGGGEPC